MGNEMFLKSKNPKYSYFNDDDHMMDFNSELIKNLELFLKSLN